MITLDSIRKPVEAELNAYNEFVEQQFSTNGGMISEMVNYALTSRGKGIRPLLVILAAVLNAPNRATAQGRRVSLAATLVEMIHLSSLIHDDVIDESDMRRGKPSVNARWQSHKAVVLGDYLLSRTLNIGLQSGQFDLVTHICGAIATLCEGEIEQADCVEKQVVSRQEYFEVIYKKTASLLGISASAGALAVRATHDKIALMRRLGEALGMVFQIQDDILDYRTDAKMGKPACNDLREGKITLPLIVVLEKADEKRRKKLLERLKECRESDEAVDELRRIVEEEDGLKEAREVMAQYVNRAMAILSQYDKSDEQKALADLCMFIVERDC